MASSTTQMSLGATKDTQIIKGNVAYLIAKIIASMPREQLDVLRNRNLSAVMTEGFDLRMYSKALSLRAKPEEQETLVLHYLRCVTEYGNRISYHRQNFTQEQSTALSRPPTLSLQAEREHDDPIVSNFTAELEGFPSSYRLEYNRTKLLDKIRSNDLKSEIIFLRKSLCSLLLQPTADPRSFERMRSQVVDALGDGEADLNAAGPEEEEQDVHKQTTNNEDSDPGLNNFPMTSGHVEIQAVNEAVKKVLNAVLSLKNTIKDLPSPLSQDRQTVLHNNLEGVFRSILRFPDSVTSLLVRRKAELDAIRIDKDAAAKTLRATKEKMAAAEAKQTELLKKTEAFERDKKVADEKMKEVSELLQAVETRESFVAGRERKVVKLEEEQALEDLNYGANAAMEDEAEAAAAQARQSEHSTSPIIGLTAAVKDETFYPDVEKISSFPTAGEHLLLAREAAITAKEGEMWHRENNLACRETNLLLRETALFAREQLLEQMKIAQIQLVENWKAQVDTLYAGLEAEREDLAAKFRALIALKSTVGEMQARVRNLIGEARGVISRVGGWGGGEDKGA